MLNDIITVNSINKRILIVDDDPTVLRALSLIASNFANIVAVSSGRKAIDVLKEQSFDLILTDYDMKQGNGLDVLSFVTANKISSPVIMITGYGSKDLAIKSLNLKVAGFIEKPINALAVEEKIKELINFKNDERDSKIFAKLGESTLKLLTENPIRFEGLENVLLELNRKSQDREIADFSEIEKVSSTLKRLSALVEKTQKAIQFENTDLQVEQFSLIDCLKDVQFSVLEKLIESKTFLLISKNVDTQLKADRVLMTQVLENLILNSIKSMTDLEEKWISVDVANKKGMVQIILSDSSLSVEKKVRSHIFDIDFSTKFNEHMGLTLMFVRNIMSVHGGSFVLDEKSSHNSFVISLPEIS